MIGLIFFSNKPPTTSDETTATFKVDNIGVEKDGYRTWVSRFGLTGTNSVWTVDVEPDGIDNFTEYLFGGDPTKSDAASILPRSGMLNDTGFQGLEYVYRRYSDYEARGLEYTVECTTNLLIGTWSTNEVVVSGASFPIIGIQTVTNRISTAVEDEQFLRLKVEEH
ncbi:MAG: hypothetical protein K9M45_07930 [Kiritimatiellales bacterium]|nr:hypothetical protein [Kiritimatiellales bacterium]